MITTWYCAGCGRAQEVAPVSAVTLLEAVTEMCTTLPDGWRFLGGDLLCDHCGKGN